MNNRILQFAALFLSAILLFVPVLSFAQSGSPLDELPGIDLTFGDVYCIFLRAMSWFFSFALVIAIILLIVNGLRYIFASGNPDAIVQAHKNLAWIAVGIAVILLSISILLIIASFLGVVTTGFEELILPRGAESCDVIWWWEIISRALDVMGAY